MQYVSAFERKVLIHLLVLHQSRFPLLKGRRTLHRGRLGLREKISATSFSAFPIVRQALCTTSSYSSSM